MQTDVLYGWRTLGLYNSRQSPTLAHRTATGWLPQALCAHRVAERHLAPACHTAPLYAVFDGEILAYHCAS